MIDTSRIDEVVRSLCAARDGDVCFDADGVLWREDAGNEYLLHCIAEHILDPGQEQIARQSWDSYSRGELPDGRLSAIDVEVLQGLTEEFVASDTRTFIQSRFRAHLIPEIGAWIGALSAAGVRCWVVSGSNRWAVAAGAEMVGIPPERVLAVANVVRDGVLTGELEQPFVYGEGKAAAIRKRLRSMPVMCFGNTGQDIPMLRLATRLAVAVEPDGQLRETASFEGWAVIG